MIVQWISGYFRAPYTFQTNLYVIGSAKIIISVARLLAQWCGTDCNKFTAMCGDDELKIWSTHCAFCGQA